MVRRIIRRLLWKGARVDRLIIKRGWAQSARADAPLQRDEGDGGHMRRRAPSMDHLNLRPEFWLGHGFDEKRDRSLADRSLADLGGAEAEADGWAGLRAATVAPALSRGAAMPGSRFGDCPPVGH
jgi:hypothetical protein